VPRLPKLRIGALEDLAKQLRFAPQETLRRQLERTERLAEEIDPARNYPEDWLVFRVTGYKSQIESPAMFVGEALLGDLSALVERLSAGAKIPESELKEGAFLGTTELSRRWKVSTKTLERYRRVGLMARRVVGPRGRSRLAFPIRTVERFEQRQRARLEAAGEYTRIEDGVREEMLRRAAAYRRRLGWSLNQAAKRLAGHFGRGHETVRQLLRRHDAASTRPIFGEPGPPSARERRLIDRAYWGAIDPAEIASRLGRSRAAVLRVIADERARRVRGLGLGVGVGGGGRQPAAELTALQSAACTEGLGAAGPTDLLEFLAAARAVVVSPAPVERARAQGYQALVARAAAAIGGLPAHGAKTASLDRIETDLRWATRLKVELMRSQLPLLVRTVEAAIGRPAEEVRGSLLGRLIEDSLAALSTAVDAFEPGKGGRLAAPAGLALSRAAARFVKEHAAELGLTPARFRATTRVGPGVRMRDWTLEAAPWQQLDGRAWLEPRVKVRAGLGSLPAREREVLARRFGWGPAPATLQDVARAMSTTAMVAGRAERRAIRAAVHAARSERRR
jgi:RNA polymerase primary sigma factor